MRWSSIDGDGGAASLLPIQHPLLSLLIIFFFYYTLLQAFSATVSLELYWEDKSKNMSKWSVW